MEINPYFYTCKFKTEVKLINYYVFQCIEFYKLRSVNNSILSIERYIYFVFKAILLLFKDTKRPQKQAS